MNMKVRTCVLAVALVLLGTSSVFAQNWSVGAPAGSIYANTGAFNYAVNREGTRELFPPVTICATAAGGAGAAGPGVQGEFNVGDVYQIEYKTGGGLGFDPQVAVPGTLTGTTVQVFQTTGAAGQAVGVTAVSEMFQPPSIGGATPGPPQALVVITVTTAPNLASGINCVTIENLHFDIADTPQTATTAGPLPANAAITGSATQTSLGTNPGVETFAIPPGTPAGVLATGFPFPAGTNAVATTASTLFDGNPNAVMATVLNPTGFTSAVGGVTAGSLLINPNLSPALNPAGLNGVTSTVPKLTQGGVTSTGVPTTATGTLAITENDIAATSNLSIPLGGGLFRSFVTSGPDTTTLLNFAGATTGTQIIINVFGMPTGSSVTFPATIAASGASVLTMALVGSGTVSAPGGTVTYVTTDNEGPATSGAELDIIYTVTTGSAAGTAKFFVSVGPATGTIPAYNAVNLSDVFPSQLVANTGLWALFTVAGNQTTRTYPYVLYTGGTTPQDYDTGIALTNSGKFPSVTAGVAAEINIGQDGPFTIFLLSSSGTVTSIRSTATNFPGPTFLTGGNLKQGDSWQALLSQVTAAAGVTGAWKGSLVVVADFPNSSGFAFISQFTNASGGATMGYVAQ